MADCVVGNDGAASSNGDDDESDDDEDKDGDKGGNREQLKQINGRLLGIRREV